jgi:tRNA pseudouridine32 synthase / 23S rRNA pseudouridine746 synthase
MRLASGSLAQGRRGNGMIQREGAEWYALYKPPGLPVFHLHGEPESDCLCRRWLLNHPQAEAHEWEPGFLAGITHRLDIPTSGMVVVAKDPSALVKIRQLFTAKKLRKRYLFLSAKQVPWKEHTIDNPIAHDRRRKQRMVVKRGNSTPHRGRWRSAETRLLKLAAKQGMGLWQAEMETGEMHQIRLHAAFAGVALAGDRLYGGGERPFGFPVDFALHHAGLAGTGLHPEMLPPPDWWPGWAKESASLHLRW